MFQLWSQKTHQIILRINAVLSLAMGIASLVVIFNYASINWPEKWLGVFCFVTLVLWLVSSTQNKIYLILNSPRKFLAKKTFIYLTLVGLFAVFSGQFPLTGQFLTLAILVIFFWTIVDILTLSY